MALRIPQCPRCSGACELKTLPSVSGEDGALKLSALDLPLFACVKKHHVPVQRDFMLWLIQEIRAREPRVPAGKQEGLLFKKHLCGACGKALAPRPERRQAFPFELEYEGLAPFRLELEMPV